VKSKMAVTNTECGSRRGAESAEKGKNEEKAGRMSGEPDAA